MPPHQIVRLSGTNGQPLLMVWEPDQQEFLTIEGRTQWSDWNRFRAELRGHWNSAIDQGGAHTDQRFWEYLQQYERNAPNHLKSSPTHVENRDRDKKMTRERWIVGGLLSFFVIVVGSLLWEQGIAPLLGRLGVIEYKTPSQERYERFLAGVQDCQALKTVSTGATNNIPPFQVFICPGGQEKIWAHKIEVVRKSANGSWVLEQ